MADDEAPQKENVMKEVRPPALLRSGCPASRLFAGAWR